MRFAYGMHASVSDAESPSAEYWRGSEGEVDFVFEIEDTPIPIGLAYQSGQHESTVATLQEFKAKYDTPVGLVLAGNTVRSLEPIEDIGDGIIQFPYWLYLLLC